MCSGLDNEAVDLTSPGSYPSTIGRWQGLNFSVRGLGIEVGTLARGRSMFY